MSLDQIDHVIFLMLENRSFDHLLGFLSLPPFNRADVDGLRPNLANPYAGNQYPIFRLTDPDLPLPDRTDPPHERRDIALQLKAGLPGHFDPPPYSMDGFVLSYPASFAKAPDGKIEILPIRPGSDALVMGYYGAEDLPATSSLAAQFCICDRWFCSLPAGTQPNRLMAFAGESLVDVNRPVTLPPQYLVYDWLQDHGVNWRVYHEGLPFFLLMDDWRRRILFDDHFLDYDDFFSDWKDNSKPMSSVIFIEPRYTDAPHIAPPSDDHAPSPVGGGERFLARVAAEIQSNPTRWQKTLWIVTFDEHGSFYDHVEPPGIRTLPPSGADYIPFESLGIRVPSLLISPFVAPGSVYHRTLDHTSFLQLLGEKFNAGSYSPTVDERTRHPEFGRISEALTLPAPRPDTPKSIPLRPSPNLSAPMGYVPGTTPTATGQQAFAAAAAQAVNEHPEQVRAKFPELLIHFPFLGPLD